MFQQFAGWSHKSIRNRMLSMNTRIKSMIEKEFYTISHFL